MTLRQQPPASRVAISVLVWGFLASLSLACIDIAGYVPPPNDAGTCDGAILVVESTAQPMLPPGIHRFEYRIEIVVEPGIASVPTRAPLTVWVDPRQLTFSLEPEDRTFGVRGQYTATVDASLEGCATSGCTRVFLLAVDVEAEPRPVRVSVIAGLDDVGSPCMGATGITVRIEMVPIEVAPATVCLAREPYPVWEACSDFDRDNCFRMCADPRDPNCGRCSTVPDECLRCRLVAHAWNCVFQACPEALLAWECCAYCDTPPCGGCEAEAAALMACPIQSCIASLDACFPPP